jgi:diketogulonate reductase-like aldo/keto reductase
MVSAFALSAHLLTVATRGHMIQPAKSVPESIKDSLEALGVPIDLYLIHVGT